MPPDFPKFQCSLLCPLDYYELDHLFVELLDLFHAIMDPKFALESTNYVHPCSILISFVHIYQLFYHQQLSMIQIH